MKKKLFAAVLAGLLAFGPVITTTITVRGEEAPASRDAIAAAGKTTQYDGEKTKYQALIDAMIEVTKFDAFGKPAYTWTQPDLADFVNKKFPNMEKKEEESDVFWKDGEAPSKRKSIIYQMSKKDVFAYISQSDLIRSDGSIDTSDNDALYSEFYENGNSRAIQANDSVSSSGSIKSFVNYYDADALAKLSTLNGALTLIDDADVVNYMNTERELDNSRQYSFSDGTKLIFTPNGNTGYVDDSHADDVDAYIMYYFRNHIIEMGYHDGVSRHVHYSTTITPTDMYRLYNPNSGEHFYTGSREEADTLVAAGWSDEGLGWKAPVMSDTPVYRLYNPNSGDHHYTPDEGERNNLISSGWNDEGIGWYSFERQTTSLYRLYNPNAASGTHHYTTDKDERDFLVKNGWVDEGIGWYGM